MNTIQKNLICLRKKISVIAKNNHKDPENILLIAVSKNQSIQSIEKIFDLQQYHFGENYVQEAIKKISWFRKTQKKIIWHFIGHLQSNKSHIVSKNFDWCHTIDRFKIINLLEYYRPKNLSPLNVLIQINIENEITKSGVSTFQKILSLAKIIRKNKKLKLRGLMSIPKLEKNIEKQLIKYKKIYFLFKKLQNIYPDIDTLSLGTSIDLTSAIISGSNLIRIGTDIFGKRKNTISKINL